MIVYDLTALQPHGNVKNHGGGTYAKYVLDRMIERNIAFVAIFDSSRYFDNGLKNRLILHKIELIDIHRNEGIRILDQYAFSPLIFSILPHQNLFAYPTIGTIHDCRVLELPNDWFELKYPFRLKRLLTKLFNYFFPNLYYKRKLNQLRYFLESPNFYPATISAYTKYLLYVHFREKRFLSMPIFSTPFIVPAENTRFNEQGKYFLLVSGDRWLKNNLRAIIALDHLFSSHCLDGYKVIITGAKSPSIYKYRIRNIDNFIFKGYVSELNLRTLYQEAYCFIFPSLNEGYGIPPIESMYFGTPVLASYLSAVTEVCQNAAIYFNPYDIKDIMAKILMITNDKALYNKQVSIGKAHANNMMKKAASDIDKYIDYVISKDVELCHLPFNKNYFA